MTFPCKFYDELAFSSTLETAEHTLKSKRAHWWRSELLAAKSLNYTSPKVEPSFVTLSNSEPHEQYDSAVTIWNNNSLCLAIIRKLIGHCSRKANWSGLMLLQAVWGFPSYLLLLSINIYSPAVGYDVVAFSVSLMYPCCELSARGFLNDWNTFSWSRLEWLYWSSLGIGGSMAIENGTNCATNVLIPVGSWLVCRITVMLQ